MRCIPTKKFVTDMALVRDMICIGNTEALYYCFRKEGGDAVAKTRLATEELYKMTKKK